MKLNFKLSTENIVSTNRWPHKRRHCFKDSEEIKIELIDKPDFIGKGQLTQMKMLNIIFHFTAVLYFIEQYTLKERKILITKKQANKTRAMTGDWRLDDKFYERSYIG